MSAGVKCVRCGRPVSLATAGAANSAPCVARLRAGRGSLTSERRLQGTLCAGEVRRHAAYTPHVCSLLSPYVRRRRSPRMERLLRGRPHAAQRPQGTPRPLARHSSGVREEARLDVEVRSSRVAGFGWVRVPLEPLDSIRSAAEGKCAPLLISCTVIRF